MKFIDEAIKLFNGKYDKVNSNVIKLNVGGRKVYLLKDKTDEKFKPTLNLILTNDNISLPNDDVHLICIINGEKLNTIQGNSHYLSYEQLNTDSVRSILSYTIIFSDVIPFGFHIKDNLTEESLDFIKRLFRTIDNDMDSKISIKEFADFHYRIFNTELTENDYKQIYRALHNDAEPLYIENYEKQRLNKEDFINLIKYYIKIGLGSSIIQMFRGAGFFYFFDVNVKVDKMFFKKKKPEGIKELGEKFLMSVYEDFRDMSFSSDLDREFSYAGGTPNRFSNLKMIDESIWINTWREWVKIELPEALRYLLSLGFPKEKIYDAFGMPVPKEYTGGSILAGLSAAAVAGSALFLAFRRR